MARSQGAITLVFSLPLQWCWTTDGVPWSLPGQPPSCLWDGQLRPSIVGDVPGKLRVHTKAMCVTGDAPPLHTV